MDRSRAALTAFLGCCLLDRDSPAARLAFRGGQRDLEHAVLEPRFDGVRIRAFRKREPSLEAPVAALAEERSAPRLLCLLLPFAGDDELVAYDLDANVVGLESGKLGANDASPATLERLNLRRPGPLRELLERSERSERPSERRGDGPPIPNSEKTRSISSMKRRMTENGLARSGLPSAPRGVR